MASKDWNNMLSGRLYHAQDSELTARRLRARKLVFRYNQSAPEEEELRRELARELFGGMGESRNHQRKRRTEHPGSAGKYKPCRERSSYFQICTEIREVKE